jgi:Ni,Fe-hydrogenase maturation factor
MRRIVCIGNRYVAEDAAGPRVFDAWRRGRCRGRGGRGRGAAGLDLLRCAEGAEVLVFVDASAGLAPPGEAAELDPEALAGSSSRSLGHAAGLPYLLRALGLLRARAPDGEGVGVEPPSTTGRSRGGGAGAAPGHHRTGGATVNVKCPAAAVPAMSAADRAARGPGGRDRPARGPGHRERPAARGGPRRPPGLGDHRVAGGQQFVQLEEVLRVVEEKAASEKELSRKLEAELRASEQRQRELDEARAAAESANRTKSTFLANMSHELRTPLNAIIGYAEMLAEDAEDRGDEPSVADLKKIHGAAKHLLSLINDVLDSRRSRPQDRDLRRGARRRRDAKEVATPSGRCWRRRPTRSTRVAADVGELRSDLTRLRQCLFNLLGNAAKFPEAGTSPSGRAARAAAAGAGPERAGADCSSSIRRHRHRHDARAAGQALPAVQPRPTPPPRASSGHRAG